MDNCPACGCSYALVGRVHNCRPRVIVTATPFNGLSGDTTVPREQGQTYKYRDKSKRQAQVAANMRAYRARKKRAPA